MNQSGLRSAKVHFSTICRDFKDSVGTLKHGARKPSHSEIQSRIS